MDVSNQAWTQKYLGSGHHTDRFVRTEVKFEDKTGTDFPYRWTDSPYLRRKHKSIEELTYTDDGPVRRCNLKRDSAKVLYHDAPPFNRLPLWWWIQAFYREPARSKQSRYGRSSYAGRHSSQDLYDEPATSHRYSTQRSYIRTAHRPAYKAAYHDDDFGYGYGGDYDSDYMYNVARKRAFRAATGTKAHSGLKRRAYTYHTPAGRRFDYGTDYYHYPSYRSYAEPDHSYYGSRTALAFSSSALHDAADISSASKRQDRRLLNAITNTLAITSGYGHRPARLHHYNYGYEVPSYETHHYHRSFPADVRKAVVLAVKARPYYGDYHRYHTYRYHSHPAPVVSIPPAITYTRPHSGYRTQTDIAVSTGAVQDAYRALNKLERGWAHEDYDVSPLHLHHRVYGHHHGHHIEPYGASHVSRAGVSSSTRSYHGGSRPGRGAAVTIRDTTWAIIPTAAGRLGGRTASRRADH